MTVIKIRKHLRILPNQPAPRVTVPVATTVAEMATSVITETTSLGVS